LGSSLGTMDFLLALLLAGFAIALLSLALDRVVLAR
jgi:hypothetical protein